MIAKNFDMNRFIEKSFCFFAFLWSKLAVIYTEKNRSVVLVPPTGPGSLGDQAMVCSLAENLALNGFQKIIVVRFSNNDDWGEAEKHFSGHIQWPRKNLLTWLAFSKLLTKSSHFMVIGADIVDGKYGTAKPRRMIMLANLASKLGLDTRICGFSFNETPHPVMISAFKTLDKNIVCYCRDPSSASRFRKQTGLKTQECTDLAFLLNPKDSEKLSIINNWISSQKSSGKTVVAINLNYLPYTFLKSKDVSKNKIINGVTASISNILSEMESISVIFTPHDYRGKNSDNWFSKEVFSKIGSPLNERCYLIEENLEASEIKCLAAKVDCSITGRMHFLIALLSQSTPAIGVTYQGKFDGVYQNFGLPSLTIEPEQMLDPKSLLKSLASLLDSRKGYTESINYNLPKILEASRKQIPE